MSEPQNNEAEDAVLGAMLLSRSATEQVLPGLDPEHFFRRSNAAVFAAIRRVHLAGHPAEPLLVIDELERSGRLEAAGGRVRVHELSHSAVASANAPHHARLVRQMWEKRELANTLAPLLKAVTNGGAAAETLEQAERSLLDLRGRFQRGRSSVVAASEAADDYQSKLDSPPKETLGVATPFNFLRRLQPGRLYVLGGYQADGKTALSVQFLKAAAKDGARVGFVSVEMSWRDLTDRIVASYGVPYRDAISGHVSLEHMPVAGRAVSELRSWNLDLIDDEGVDASGLRRYQQLGRYDVLIIDHLHRFDWKERRDLERIVRTITNISREFEIPVLLLAQLHRRGDEFPRPTMSSLRESGMIEAEAASVWFVWRQRDDKKLPTEEAEFLVAKNRYGPTGSYPLHFRSHEVRFVEME